MIQFALALRRLERPVLPAAAWLLTGRDAAAWLRELTCWAIPLTQMRLYVLPDGEGAIAVAPGAAKPAPTPKAVPYRELAGKLFFPADSRLDPEVSADEVTSLVPWHMLVLHPALGAIGFRREDALGVAALLARPARRATVWDRAVPALPPAMRLLGVEPARADTVETVLDEGRDDIASKTSSELPAKLDGPGDGRAGQAGRWVGRGLAQTVQWLTHQVPAGAPQRTWIDDLQDWSRRKLDEWGVDLEAARNRELNRLLRLLESDPDEGLRYAMPLASSGGRGLAEPGARLGRRDADFRLDRLGGGRPADAWSAPWQVRQKLVLAYRKQAVRELGLKRYRRAAYIYAELLGDYEAAADSLKQGHHWREAAVLYRDHLRRPLEAARCLEEGGLLLEAIVLYEQEKEFLQAALLYQKLDRLEDATRAFRDAASEMLTAGNALGAAQVLEVRLGAPDEALAVLSAAWPASPQASKCLVERFNLLGRLRRHEEASRLLPRLAAAPVPDDRITLLAESFSAVARAYPDRGVRARAADLTRIIAGARLPRALPGETVGLVQAVARLAPEDKLLARDAVRFVARSQRRAAAPASAVLPGTRRPVVVAQFALSEPGETRWLNAAAAGQHLYAAGTNKASRIVLSRLSWEGDAQKLRWYKPVWEGEELLIAAPRYGCHPVLLWLHGGMSPGHLRDHPVREFADGTPAGSPAWLPGSTLALCYSENDLIWLLKRARNAPPVLCAHSPDGALLRSTELDAAAQGGLLMHGAQSLPMAAQSHYVFVATSQYVHQIFAGEKTRALELPGRVRELSLSMPNTRLRVVVVLDEGGVVFWPSRMGEGTVQGVFGERLARPKVALLGDGRLVALTRSEGRVYDTNLSRLRHKLSFEGPGEDPVAVLATQRPSEFAVVMPDGAVKIWRLPAR